MFSQTVKLRREELYEKVWTTPMWKLAKEFTLSDRGLAKLCQRHKIPVPGRGYWARLAAGQKPPRARLPAITDARLELIEIVLREQQVKEDETPMENVEIPQIAVAADRPITHPLAVRMESLITATKTDERGLLLPRKDTVVNLHVSTGALPRALRLLDALLFALDEEKHTVKWEKPYNAPLKVIIQEEELQFSITELVQRKDHEPTEEEIARQKKTWISLPRWDYFPTGQLCLEIHTTESVTVRKKWTDGKHRHLEDCLGRVLVTFPVVAVAQKKRREEVAEQHRKWEEERKREEEMRRRREEYERKAKAMTKLADSWKQSGLFRDFATAIRAAVELPDVPEEQRQELQKIAEWASRHADYVNPLTDLRWTIEQFKNPPWY